MENQTGGDRLKKEPSNTQVLQVLLFGLGLLSFGIWTIWIPYIGMALFIFGAFMVIASIATIAIKMLK